MSAWLDFPQRLDPLEYRLIIAAAGMIALAAFVAAFVFVRRARLIEDTPTSRLRSAALGYVELEGEAVMMAGVPIVAPLTLTPCAWFRYCIEERVDDDKRALGRWRTHTRGASDGLFALRDDTGRCVVDPEGATVMPSVTQVWYGDTASPPPVNLPHPLFGSRYRYREERIHNGDYLYAMGELRSSGGAEGAGRAETVRALLAAWKRDQAGLLARFDRNRDGAIDGEEWEQVRTAAEREAAAEVGQRLSEPDVLLLARSQDDRRPYMLSTLPPRRLTARYRLFAAASFCLFLLGGSVALWFLNSRLA